MSNKRAYFIVGSEGSGTYMMAEALVEAGCHYIPDEDDFQLAVENCEKDTVVVRRSVPHAGEFIDLYTLAAIMRDTGFDLRIIAIVREPNATINSVFNRVAQDKESILDNMHGAWTCISELMQGFTVLPITYEAMIGSKGFRQWLFNDYLYLKQPSNYIFLDANRKYYE